MSTSDQEQNSRLRSAELDNLLKDFFPQGLIVLDTETTGLSPLIDRVIEIGCVKWTPAKGLEFFQTLINPEIPIPEVTTKIHGITDDMVKDQPSFNAIQEDFLNFIQDLPLMAHNARFDLGFLLVAFFQSNTSLGKREVYCSCQLARKLLPKLPGHRLKGLCEYYKIDLTNHHRAMDDAKACLEVVVGMLEDYKKSVAQKANVALQDILKFAKMFNTQDYDISFDAFNLPSHLKLLKDKVHAQETVEIIYNGGSHRGKWRQIKPVGLLPLPGGPSLYALCHISNLYKYFSLSKIQEVREVTIKAP